MIDLHAHLMPGVDDGAQDAEESAIAVRSLQTEGFTEVSATPHLNASLAATPTAWEATLARFDEAWASLRAVRDETAPGLTIHRGVELMLDIPDPVLSDPRIRLAGGNAILVEFPRLGVPPSMPALLSRMRDEGYLPVVAHPERYDSALAGDAERWRAAGAALLVNTRAAGGGYGPRTAKAASTLFARGLVDAVATDFHARGTPGATDFVSLLTRAAGADTVHLLTVANPRALLAGEPPASVPPIRFDGGLASRFRELFR